MIVQIWDTLPTARATRPASGIREFGKVFQAGTKQQLPQSNPPTSTQTVFPLSYVLFPWASKTLPSPQALCSFRDGALTLKGISFFCYQTVRGQIKSHSNFKSGLRTLVSHSKADGAQEGKLEKVYPKLPKSSSIPHRLSC